MTMVSSSHTDHPAERQVAWDPRRSPSLLVVGDHAGPALRVTALTLHTEHRLVLLSNSPSLAGLPSAALLAFTAADQLAALHHVHEVMKDRYRALEQDPLGRNTALEPIAVMIEDLDWVLSTTTTWWATHSDLDRPTPTLGYLRHLMHHGTAVRVHLAIAAPTPAAIRDSIQLIGTRPGAAPREPCITGPITLATSALLPSTGHGPRSRIDHDPTRTGWERVRTAQVVWSR